MVVILLPLVGIALVAAYQGAKANKWRKSSLNKSIRSFWSRPYIYPSNQRDGEELTQEEQVDELQNQDALARVLSPLNVTQQQIRLLKVEYNDDPDSPLQCSFESANLGDNPAYVALSYRWGRTNSRYHILIDGELVQVTQNLYQALIEMRKRGIYLVWVDALCIDQREGLERHNQFRKLTRIYSRAQYVFSWLGRSNDLIKSMKSTLDALHQYRASTEMLESTTDQRNALQDLYDLWSRSTVASKRQVQYVRVAETVSTHVAESVRKIAPDIADSEIRLQSKHTEFLNALYTVLDNEYWQRAWVLQELTMAGRIEIHYNDLELEWDLFAEIVEELYQLHEEGDFPHLTPNHRHVCNIVRLRPQLQRTKLPLITVLRMSYGTKATRPCDKVYSLIGLCADDHKFVVTTEEIDLRTLQLRMTQNYIRETKNLDLICLKLHHEDDSLSDALPSWVPNLITAQGDKFCHRMLDYLTGQDKHTHLAKGEKYWSATKKDAYLQNRLSGHTQVLGVKARLIGYITDLSGALDGTSMSEPLQSHRQTPVWKKSRRELDYFFEENDFILARRIYEALTVYKARIAADDNILDFSHLWSSAYLQRLRKSNPQVHEWLVAHETFVIHDQTLGDWSHGKRKRLDPWRPVYKGFRMLRHVSAVEDELLDGVDSFAELSLTAVFNQRIDAITASLTTVLEQGLRLMGGKYASDVFPGNTGDRLTGWAHPASQLNDGIYLLQGCSMPVVLRPVDKPEFAPAYRIIGDAYAAGAMNGELWTGWEQDLTDINLI